MKIEIKMEGTEEIFIDQVIKQFGAFSIPY